MPTNNPSGPGRWLSAIFGWWHRPTLPADQAAAADRDLVMRLAPSRIPNVRQLRHLNDVLLASDKRTIRIAGLVTIISALFLLGHAIARHVTLVPVTGGTLTEGLVGSPQYINPVLARPFSVDADLSRLTFRGLMKVDGHQNIVPDLATSLTVSSDGKTYTIKLPKSLVWSDGVSLTTADVKYTIQTAADPTYQSPYQNLFKGVTITTPNDQTAVLTLPAALNAFPSYLTIGILPAHAWQDATPQTFALAELNLKPISNGLYHFQSLTKDQSGNIRSFTFIRNKTSGPPAYLDKVVIKFYPDQTTALDALEKNAVDTLGGISLDNLAAVKKNHQVSAFTLSQLTAVFFNQRNNPALRAKEVRQALALAVDKPAIIKTPLQGFGQVIQGPLLPGQTGFNAGLKQYPFNLDQARSLLDQNGWKMNAQGIRQKGSQQLTFVLTTVNDPVYQAVAQKLAGWWTSIGARVELRTIEATQVQKDIIQPRNFEALLFGEIYDAAADPYPLWDSSQQKTSGFNLAISTLTGVDQDVEDARTTTDPAKQAKDLFDFQNIVAEQVPAIFLYQTEYLYAHPKSLRGFPSSTLVTATDRFNGLASWYLDTGLKWK